MVTFLVALLLAFVLEPLVVDRLWHLGNQRRRRLQIFALSTAAIRTMTSRRSAPVTGATSTRDQMGGLRRPCSTSFPRYLWSRASGITNPGSSAPGTDKVFRDILPGAGFNALFWGLLCCALLRSPRRFMLPGSSDCVPRRKNNAYLDCIALNISNITVGTLSVPFEVKCDSRRPDAQIVNTKRVQKWRQMGIDDDQFTLVRIGSES